MDISNKQTAGVPLMNDGEAQAISADPAIGGLDENTDSPSTQQASVIHARLAKRN